MCPQRPPQSSQATCSAALSLVKVKSMLLGATDLLQSDFPSFVLQNTLSICCLAYLSHVLLFHCYGADVDILASEYCTAISSLIGFYGSFGNTCFVTEWSCRHEEAALILVSFGE